MSSHREHAGGVSRSLGRHPRGGRRVPAGRRLGGRAVAGHRRRARRSGGFERQLPARSAAGRPWSARRRRRRRRRGRGRRRRRGRCRPLDRRPDRRPSRRRRCRRGDRRHRFLRRRAPRPRDREPPAHRFGRSGRRPPGPGHRVDLLPAEAVSRRRGVAPDDARPPRGRTAGLSRVDDLHEPRGRRRLDRCGVRDLSPI